MSTNNIDKKIASSFKNREFTPSASAWERLSSQLDEHTVYKKRRRGYQIASAASILLVLGITAFYFFNRQEVVIPQEVIVETEVNETIEVKEIELNMKPELLEEEFIVKNEKIEEKEESKKSFLSNKSTMQIDKVNRKMKVSQGIPSEEVAVIIENKKEDDLKKNVNLIKKPRIQVNGEDLLYAVTHSEEEVKAYYAKHKVKRKDVFETIKKELIKSNLTIDPEIILAEVERNIDDEEFKGDFMQRLKLKISDIAVAFVERNK